MKKKISGQDDISQLPTIERVSVIIPCFNRSDLLFECLESVAKQSYSNIEVIVVDDASTEDLKTVIDKIKWPNTFTTQYIRLEENRGPGYAREIGRRQATGDFLNYQDSDDLFHPDKIDLQVKMLKQHPEAGMCYCITLNFTSLPFDGTERLRGSHFIESILPGVLEKRPWATGSCLWTRTATDTIGPWFEGHIREDSLYEIRAGCKDIPIVYIPQILCYSRIHSGEPTQRAPSIKKYQYAVATYHEMLQELGASGKLKDSRILLTITHEIFRVSRKLFNFHDIETPFIILQHLTSIGRFNSKALKLYFFSAQLILFSRHVIIKKYQPIIFDKLCNLTMIIGNLFIHRSNAETNTQKEDVIN